MTSLSNSATLLRTIVLSSVLAGITHPLVTATANAEEQPFRVEMPEQIVGKGTHASYFQQAQRISDARLKRDEKNPEILFFSVWGVVNSGGWGAPILVPASYETPPEDGILDLNLMGRPPKGMATQVISEISVSHTMYRPFWMKGARIHSAQNTRTLMLETEAEEATPETAEPKQD